MNEQDCNDRDALIASYLSDDPKYAYRLKHELKLGEYDRNSAPLSHWRSLILQRDFVGTSHMTENYSQLVLVNKEEINSADQESSGD